ncbi:MAG: NAD/NADP octopine/nopaline dehydrogenase [Promethearchaeota archaeon]|nr:MAG: NAD/NADP octopine/nopaline dehydrogenase [Candidatus Lokiarchaeota archaeon]
MKFCVIGAGSGGRAVAAYLASMEYSVNLYNRSSRRIKYIKRKGGIEANGALKGFFPLNKTTQDLESAINDVDVIMVVVPASGHKDIAKKLSPHLSSNQIILLNPGRTFGALEFHNIVRERRKVLSTSIAETQTLLFTSRELKKNKVRIFRIKDRVNFSSFHENKNILIHKKLKRFFPQLKPVNNYFQLTLNNIGMLLHPTISLFNTGAIETKIDFKFYNEGASIRVCKIMEKIQNEINQIFLKLGLSRINFCRWAEQVYGVFGKTIYDTLRKIEIYQKINSPKKLKTRYLTEDVPTGLVPIASLGKFLKVNTPTIDSIVHLSSILCGIDFWKKGRTVKNLELAPILKQRFDLKPSIPEMIIDGDEYSFV